MKVTKVVRLPLHRRDWRLVGTTLRRVFSRPSYVALALLVAWLCLSAFVVAGNVELFVRVVLFGDLPVSNRLSVLAAMFPFIGISFEPLSGISVLALALLVGINAALVAYHVRVHGASIETGTSGSVGLTGALLGGLGAGCAVCGTSLLAGLLSLAGASGGAILLPFDGLGVTLIAIVVVAISSFWIVEGMYGGMRRREVAES